MVRHLVFGSGASFFVSFASLVLIARLFPLEFISTVKSVTVYGGWFSVFFCFQVQSAFLYFYKKEDASSERIRAFALSFLGLSSLAAAVAFFFLYPFIHENPGLSRLGLASFSASVGMTLLFNASPAVFTAHGGGPRLPVFMFRYTASSLASLLLAYAFKWDANTYALATAVFGLAALVASPWRGYLTYARRHLAGLRGNYHRPFGTYALRISVSLFFESLGDRLDKILASKFLSQAIFAKYSVLCFENPFVNLLLNSYGIAFVKRYQGGSSGDPAHFAAEWKRMVRFITFFTFPISLFLVFNDRWFISTVFGERFADVGGVFQLYLAVTLVRYAPFQSLLRLEGAVQYNVVMSICYFLAALAMGVFVLVTNARLEFMALSYVSAWVVFNALAVYFFGKVSRVGWRAILVPGLWFSRVVQCSGAGVASSFLGGENPYMRLAVFCTIYLAVVLATDTEIRTRALQLRKRT